MNRGHLIGVVVLVVVCLAAPQSATAQTGAIKGQVLDAETMAPVVGATVMIVETQDGTAADASGSFTITDLAPGSYTVRVQSVGYAAQSLTDIIVRSNRSTPVPVRLALSAVALEGQTVETGYFRDSEEKQTSTIGFSTEEIRRSPGSAGDVSRIMFVLPSVAKVNDMVNNLIVRGGSPHENAFYLDGIEIPNINHFPFRGTTGGAIGLLNVDFIQDVEFSAGAFPATYGNRMSSVMDLQFREGTRDGFDGQLDLNFAGFGAAGEGPIGAKGSYLVSARRSYLDLLVDAVGIGVAPRYSDYQGKAVYDLSPAHRLSLIGVGSTDFIEFDREDALDIDDLVYGEYDNYLYAAGVNWRWLWGRSGYSTTSLSTLGTRQKSLFYETNTTKLWQRETALERAVQIRNVNHVRLSPSHHVEFGVEGKHRFDDYDTYTAEGTNPAGDTVPPIAYQKNVDADEVGAFVSYTWQAASRLSFTPGVRFDYFSLNENSHVSPRFSASLGLSERTTLTGAAGVYYQPLPLVLLSQHDEHLSLKDPRANHYVAGIRHLLSDDVQLTVEGYFKDYYDSPVDPEQPLLFTADEMVYRYFFGNHETLLDNGRARSYGAEVTVRKKLASGIYGLASGAWTRAQYRDTEGTWRNRVFDNRMIFTVEGGYKPNRKWEFSARWIFGGGVPYTPIDVEASREVHRTVYDMARVNEARYPDYHSLNLRVDRRFNFRTTNLVAFLSVWNVYNRENVTYYYWNDVKEEVRSVQQWGLIPVFGVEFEF